VEEGAVGGFLPHRMGGATVEPHKGRPGSAVTASEHQKNKGAAEQQKRKTAEKAGSHKSGCEAAGSHAEAKLMRLSDATDAEKKLSREHPKDQQTSFTSPHLQTVKKCKDNLTVETSHTTGGEIIQKAAADSTSSEVSKYGSSPSATVEKQPNAALHAGV